MLLFDFMEYKQSCWKAQVQKCCLDQISKDETCRIIDSYFNRNTFNPDINVDISDLHCVEAFEFRQRQSESDNVIDTPTAVSCPFCEKYHGQCGLCPYNTDYGCGPMSPYIQMMNAIDRLNYYIARPK